MERQEGPWQPLKGHSHNAFLVQVQHGSCDVVAECDRNGRVQQRAAGQVGQQPPVKLVSQSSLCQETEQQQYQQRQRIMCGSGGAADGQASRQRCQQCNSHWLWLVAPCWIHPDHTHCALSALLFNGCV